MHQMLKQKEGRKGGKEKKERKENVTWQLMEQNKQTKCWQQVPDKISD